jgi:hypothetical protein
MFLMQHLAVSHPEKLHNECIFFFFVLLTFCNKPSLKNGILVIPMYQNLYVSLRVYNT